MAVKNYYYVVALKERFYTNLKKTLAYKLNIFETENNEKSDPSVSKMLANGEELGNRPYRSRTCDTLIKSIGVLV